MSVSLVSDERLTDGPTNERTDPLIEMLSDERGNGWAAGAVTWKLDHLVGTRGQSDGWTSWKFFLLDFIRVRTAERE